MARLTPLSLLLWSAGLALAQENPDLAASYDYIIAGGGTAGLVVAHRLTEEPDVTVLIVEAGALDQQEDMVAVPGRAMGAVGTRYDWNMSYVATDYVGARAIGIPQGHVVGGSSLLNAMLFQRGTARDYDGWEELGNEGWGWEGMLEGFKKSETFSPATDEIQAEFDIPIDMDVHGTNGPVSKTFSPYMSPVIPYFIAAAEELGMPLATDSANGQAFGPMYITHSQTSWDDESPSIRSSSRVAYYNPMADRPNLTLLTEHKVHRVIIEEGRAVGIEFSSSPDADTLTASANNDVIVSSGAIGTPALLQRSGVGPADVLEAAGVEQLVDNPSVGIGLTDHCMIPVMSQTRGLPGAPANSRELYDANGTGPLASANGDLLFFMSTSQYTERGSEMAELALAQDPLEYIPESWSEEWKAGYLKKFALLVDVLTADNSTTLEYMANDGMLMPIIMQPFSRGYVSITSDDPWANPEIDAGFLKNPVDVIVLIEAIRMARRIFASDAFAEFSPTEFSPGEARVTDEELEEYVRSRAATVYHPVASCAMGPKEEGGCVDAQTMGVYGVERLRVVDASVMPMIPAAHTQATVYGLAERAVELIKAANAGVEQQKCK